MVMVIVMVMMMVMVMVMVVMVMMMVGLIMSALFDASTQRRAGWVYWQPALEQSQQIRAMPRDSRLLCDKFVNVEKSLMIYSKENQQIDHLIIDDQ